MNHSNIKIASKRLVEEVKVFAKARYNLDLVAFGCIKGSSTSIYLYNLPEDIAEETINHESLHLVLRTFAKIGFEPDPSFDPFYYTHRKELNEFFTIEGRQLI